jgi:hypothetical protein
MKQLLNNLLLILTIGFLAPLICRADIGMGYYAEYFTPILFFIGFIFIIIIETLVLNKKIGGSATNGLITVFVANIITTLLGYLLFRAAIIENFVIGGILGMYFVSSLIETIILKFNYKKEKWSLLFKVSFLMNLWSYLFIIAYLFLWIMTGFLIFVFIAIFFFYLFKKFIKLFPKSVAKP